jgi:hypothetical protein
MVWPYKAGSKQDRSQPEFEPENHEAEDPRARRSVMTGDHCPFKTHEDVPLSPTGTEEKPDDAKSAVPRPRIHRLGDLAR